MAVQKKQMFCHYCRRWVLAQKEIGIGDGWGCALTLLTGGLFLPIWLLSGLANIGNKHICPTCGSRTVKSEY